MSSNLDFGAELYLAVISPHEVGRVILRLGLLVQLDPASSNGSHQPHHSASVQDFSSGPAGLVCACDFSGMLHMEHACQGPNMTQLVPKKLAGLAAGKLMQA